MKYLFTFLLLFAFLGGSAQDTTVIIRTDTIEIDTTITSTIVATEITTIIKPDTSKFYDPCVVYSSQFIAPNSQADAGPPLTAFLKYADENDLRAVIVPGSYKLKSSVFFNSRSWRGITWIDAREAVFEIWPGVTGFRFEGDNVNRQVSHFIDWIGGKFTIHSETGVANGFNIEAAYMGRFTRLSFDFLDTCFSLSWVMGTEFDKCHFHDVKHGIHADAIEGRGYWQSTTIRVRDCRIWARNAEHLFTSDGSHGLEFENNIIEGPLVREPFFFDLRRSGVAKLITFKSNWFETPSEAAVRVVASNGASLVLSGNYFAEYVERAVDASTTEANDHTVLRVFMQGNHIPPEVKLRGTRRAQFYTGFQYYEPDASKWDGEVPFHNYRAKWDRFN